MQEEEAAGFVPVVGNLWLAAPEHTHTCTELHCCSSLLFPGFSSWTCSSSGAAELRSDFISGFVQEQIKNTTAETKSDQIWRPEALQRFLAFLIIILILHINIYACELQ